jgi:hypothetical protein
VLVKGGVTYFNASVQPTDARDVPDHMREEAATYYTVYFADDPGLNIRDLITWHDPTPAKTLFVIGKEQDAAGIRNTWKVLCAERT